MHAACAKRLNNFNDKFSIILFTRMLFYGTLMA